MARRPTILIGTDCPALTLQHIQQALRSLEQGQSFCIPATDGGYVLIALSCPAPVIFQGIDWGSSRVMRQTLRAQRRSQLTWRNSGALPDLDTPRDLAQQRRAGLLGAW